MSTGGVAIRSNSIANGFSLVEVLVALVVLSIGLLSIAGLVSRSLASSNAASNRAEAIRAVYMIADSIRSNPQGAWAGEYNVSFGAAPAGANRAGQDITAWKAALTRVGGDGSIRATNNLANSVATVTVRWKDPIAGGLASETEYVHAFNF